MRKVNLIAGICVLAITVMLLIPADPAGPNAYAGKMSLSYFEELNTVKEIMHIIQNQYVDGEKVEPHELVYGAVEGMIKKLDDPYTRFMRPEAFENMQQETAGEFGGLGILIGVKDNWLTVISPIEGTPAYKAGIRSGDKITKVNGKSTHGMSVNDAVKLLRGPKGTKVHLAIRREASAKPLEYAVMRDAIKIPSVRGKMIDDHIGYARLSQFISTSADDLERVVSKLESDYDLQGFILDLRNNPGGLLNAAVEVSKIFLAKGKVVSIKGRKGEEVTYSAYTATHKPFAMVVLINEGSASASEIVAGAMHDNHRAVLVGKRSFGKGSVQTVLPLSDGSAAAVTTAYYYTPSGTCIHKVGILPDVEADIPTLNEAQLKEYREDQEKAFQESVEPISTGANPSKLKVSRFDTQLRAAVDLLHDSKMMADISKATPMVAHSVAAGTQVDTK